jgi:hypothetical protein
VAPWHVTESKTWAAGDVSPSRRAHAAASHGSTQALQPEPSVEASLVAMVMFFETRHSTISPLAPDAPLVVLPDDENLCVEASPAPMTVAWIGFMGNCCIFFCHVATPHQQRNASMGLWCTT